MPPCCFVIKWLRILMLRVPWEQGHTKYGVKRAPCKARHL